MSEEEKIKPEEVTKKPTTKKPTSKKETENQHITKNKYPTLCVKNFGKIEEAEVELAPFTLFVGDNNSGKSYLMNLIWGLSNIHLKDLKNNVIFKNIRDYNQQNSYQNIENYIHKIHQQYLKENKRLIDTIPNDIIVFTIELLNTLLQDQKSSFIKEIFNIENDSITIDHLEIRLPQPCKFSIPIEIFRFPKKNINKQENKIEYINVLMIGNRGNEIAEDRDLTEFIIRICEEVIQQVFSWSNLFLPSSRTGFTLLKGDLKGQALDNFLDIDEPIDELALKLDLTPATKEFVRQYFKLKSVEYEENDILELIENKMIDGKVYLEDIGLNGIKYQPHNTTHSYEAKNTSAVVTELAPLILFLKYQNNWQTLIMEEPEISLHPQLQQQMARVLIKLANKNKNKVFITTHSDTIIQHINNMIKLANKTPERQKELFEKFEYDKDDIIDFDQIRMYQFDVPKEGNSKDKTIVSSLKCTEDGFDAPTFNKYFVKMSNEIDEYTDEL